MMKQRHSLSWTALLAVAILFPATASAQAATPEKRGTRTIYLVRHGQYDHADERDEFTGRALVPLGVAQARLLAARLKAMPAAFTSLTSSTMTRARQTAAVIQHDLPGLEELVGTGLGRGEARLPCRGDEVDTITVFGRKTVDDGQLPSTCWSPLGPEDQIDRALAFREGVGATIAQLEGEIGSQGPIRGGVGRPRL